MTARARPTWLAISLAAALLVGACSADAPSESPVVVLTPIPTAALPSTLSPAATATPKPTPKPTPAVWTAPTLVSSEFCSTLRGGIDAAGRSHVAAYCNNHVLYSVTKSDGSWAQTVFPVPDNRIERDQQIAFQGNAAYLAYSRLAVNEGDSCGPQNVTDIGVCYRKRTQPSGAWSNPVRIGHTDDHLAQFRVDGTTIHAVVQNEGDGHAYYLLIKGTSSKRYRLPADAGSLRIGNDGRARIAWAGGGSIRIATFTGSGFSSVKVTAPDSRDAVLVLDARDRAHLLWVRDATDYGVGCTSGGRARNAGTYYATNATGIWRTERLTTDIGQGAIQIDRATGQVNVVIAGDDTLTYYTKATGGAWTHEKLPPRQARSPSISRDPATGRLLILYIDAGGSGIYMMSKGG
jgi:hypothetical protein